jgi:hypothetical protein
LGNFKHLCETGDLKDPLLVVPLSGKLKDVYVRAFEMIQQKIEAKAKKDENLQREIEQNGIGGAMRAVIGFRQVMVENKELVFTEKDPIRQITGTKYVRGLILDGQRRALGLWKNLVAEWENKKYLPEENVEVKKDVEVKVEVVEDLDMLTSTHLSVVLNMGSTELNEGEIMAFFRFNPLNKMMVQITGEKAGSASTNRVRELMIDYEDGDEGLSEDYDEGTHGLLEPPQQRRGIQEEEEERKERKWKEREELAVKEAMRPAVSEAQRQFAPTFSYAPAQPRLSAQTTISPQAQPIREEAQPQPVQLDEISVLSVALDQYFARHNPQAHYYVFPGKGIDVRLDYNLKKALENSGLSGRSLEVDIRYTNIPDFPIKIKGMQLKARVHVPVAWNKYCPNCGHLIVLSPTRCVFCGEVISPLPCVVSYKPAGT